MISERAPASFAAPLEFVPWSKETEAAALAGTGAAVLLSVSSILSGDAWPILWGAIGGAGLFLLYFVMAMVYPGGMGFGDVKLAALLGID